MFLKREKNLKEISKGDEMSIKDLLNGPTANKIEQDIRNMASEPGLADFLITMLKNGYIDESAPVLAKDISDTLSNYYATHPKALKPSEKENNPLDV